MQYAKWKCISKMKISGWVNQGVGYEESNFENYEFGGCIFADVRNVRRWSERGDSLCR